MVGVSAPEEMCPRTNSKSDSHESDTYFLLRFPKVWNADSQPFFAISKKKEKMAVTWTLLRSPGKSTLLAAVTELPTLSLSSAESVTVHTELQENISVSVCLGGYFGSVQAVMQLRSIWAVSY